MEKMFEEFFGCFFQVTVPLKWYKNVSECTATQYRQIRLKYDLNSNLLFNTSLPKCLSKITFVVTNHSIGAILNIIFLVVDKII